MSRSEPSMKKSPFARAVVAFAVCAATTFAPDSRAAEPARVALRGAEIVTVSGVSIREGIVLIENGKIAAVGGAGLSIPSGYEVIDLAPGSVVTPAFVDAHSHVGVFRETDETSSAISPEVVARDAYDPSDETITRLARSGVGTIVVSPQDGNVVGGRAAVLKPYRGAEGGADPRGRFVPKEPIKMSFGGGAIQGDREPTSRAGLLRLLRSALAESVSPAPSAAPARLFGSIAVERRRLMAEIARGERPVLASARSLEEVESALAVAKAFPLKMTIVGGLGATDAAAALAAASIGVVLPPLHPVLSREELRAPAALHAAGVALAFGSDAPLSDPTALRFSAALAVRNGLPEDAALRALTFGGAVVAGVESHTGSIEIGRDADVAVWDGPPLALSSRLLRLYVDGRLVHSLPIPDRAVETGARAETL